MRERGSGTRRVVEMALERHHVKRSSLNIVMELDSTEAIKSAVEAGLGAGFVSRWAIAKDLRVGQQLSRSSRSKDCDSGAIFLSPTPSSPGPQGLALEFRRFLFCARRRRQEPQRRPKQA